MSHSPALENCSPAATTPSTPIMRSHERNASCSPPRHHARDASVDAGVREHHKSGHHRLQAASNLQVTLPQFSSSNTNTPTSTPYLSNFTPDHQWHSQQQSPLTAPHSPNAFSSHADAMGATPSDRFPQSLDASGLRLSRKESYKAQRQHYRREKKRVTLELLSSLEDPTVTILADWLKIRGTLKSWTKLWCVLKPGLLLLYKSHKAKNSHWVGTVLLTTCHVIERPSKKDGFCFKLYHPLEQSIWAPRGPHNETIGAVVQPLPTCHLIFRAPSQTAGRSWLDGLELALKSSNMLLRCGGSVGPKVADTTTNHETQWSPEDLEKHFPAHDLEGAELSESDSEHEIPLDQTGTPAVATNEDAAERIRAHLNLIYANELNDDVGQSGEVVEELAEENKSLLWYLVKQVRPGMDLSKVVLPTFILEPRSFLDKLSDSFYHSDILASACQFSDPYDRIKTVVKWYLSGLYRKPRGLKKPYNPVLGETFRCSWIHETTGTRTYYISEQVSHHPPISAFYVSNRKEGFAIEAAILAKSKFYGNSTSAILDGAAKITLIPLGEVYIATSPYAHCKGLLMGTLSMELGGRVTITCPSTSYSADIEFKLKPFIGGSDYINMVSGRIKYNKETVATLEGHWDDRIDIKDKKNSEESVLMNVAELKHRRLKRQLIHLDHLGDFESARLWSKVSAAIMNEDQVAATEEKTVIEEAQRERAKGRGSKEWVPRYFRKGTALESDHGYNEGSGNHTWLYNYPNLTPWNDQVDILEYESDYMIKTLRRKSSSSSAKSVSTTRPLTQPETEHSGSESDSTNSHHHAASGGGHNSSVANALMRVEAELAGVMSMVGRFDNDSQDTPIKSPRKRISGTGEEPSAASLLMAVLVQQQDVAAALNRVEGALRDLGRKHDDAAKQSGSDSLWRNAILLVPIYVVCYLIYRWLFS